jgi:methenyltetrahydrofolate cyclohydrolase
MAGFGDYPLSSFLDALAAPNPTPGGGTASAIGAAMGAALLMMVGGLARSRTNTEEEKAALAKAGAALAPLRDRLTQLADADAEAFNGVMAAYRLPKSTDEEKARRKQSVQDALKAATTTPLEVLRAAGAVMALARGVAAHGNRSAASDVRVALELLEAAAAGAAANVEINIVTLEDESFRKVMAAHIVELTNKVTEDAAAARAALATPAQA